MHLISRQQITVYLVKSEFRPYFITCLLTVARQHNELTHSGGMKRPYRVFRMRFQDIGNNDVTRIYAVYGDMNDRTVAVAMFRFRTDRLHKGRITDTNCISVNNRADPHAGDFFAACHCAAVTFGLIRTPQ